MAWRATSILFSPFRLGDLELKNRIVMAPLTRNRATQGSDAPNDLNAEYYRQRACAGLIISEAYADLEARAGLYLDAGHLFARPKSKAGRKSLEAVHEAGGKIFIQLWHVGRISHVSLQPGGVAAGRAFGDPGQ